MIIVFLFIYRDGGEKIMERLKPFRGNIDFLVKLFLVQHLYALSPTLETRMAIELLSSFCNHYSSVAYYTSTVTYKLLKNVTNNNDKETY